MRRGGQKPCADPAKNHANMQPKDPGKAGDEGETGNIIHDPDLGDFDEHAYLRAFEYDPEDPRPTLQEMRDAYDYGDNVGDAGRGRTITTTTVYK